MHLQRGKAGSVNQHGKNVRPTRGCLCWIEHGGAVTADETILPDGGSPDQLIVVQNCARIADCWTWSRGHSHQSAAQGTSVVTIYIALVKSIYLCGRVFWKKNWYRSESDFILDLPTQLNSLRTWCQRTGCKSVTPDNGWCDKSLWGGTKAGVGT